MTSGSFNRIRALVLHELYVSRHSLEIFFDIVFFPFMNVIMFGLIGVFIGGLKASINSEFLLLGILLWEVVAVTQYNITVSSLWSVWSHNLTNIFIAPIDAFEYLSAHIIAAFMRTAGVMIFLGLWADLFFHFNIFHLGIINLVLFVANLFIFAIWLGLALLGLIFRFGTRVQAISWGTVFLFQPLTAAYFPLSILPHSVRYIASALPPTHVFEAARYALNHPGIAWRANASAFALNILYVLLAGLLFAYLFRRSKTTGRFARNDLG